uniref:Uncharacterized protein n=1 Tax=Utricularia reniformis TaxID=192314 RepID=A0A1Y0B1W3_9LAMI|nr:hypothetical protein AEK19_MT1167 [Utricularia reniformis]ART31381.1 hypothetical protein AEK19_MT1167 [Utricularia reniformis]
MKGSSTPLSFQSSQATFLSRHTRYYISPLPNGRAFFSTLSGKLFPSPKQESFQALNPFSSTIQVAKKMKLSNRAFFSTLE